MEDRRKLCPFAVRVEGGWGAADPPKSVRNKLLCYFQSRKKSGGGECELQLRSGQLLACFAEEEVRQRVLSQKVHELDVAGNGKLVLTVRLHETAEAPAKGLPKEERVPEQASKKEDHPEERAVQESLQKAELSSAGVNPCHDKDISEDLPGSSLVVLENIKESITHETLTLLVENISCLFGEDDFKIELLRERKTAVVTFQSNNDAADFLHRCAQNARFKSLKMTARSLEVTKMIKVENMPPAIFEGFIVLYFESTKHGGGQVSSVQMFPEEDSAIVTFCDHQVVQTVLEKRHSFERQPVLVYPYYSSLNTVLYGNERPQVKMPEPVKLSLDPYIWKFIQIQHKLVEEIHKEMGNCCCELTWPQVTCHHPEVILCPSAALSKEASRSWKDKVSMEFACIMSKFKVVKCKIIPATWDTINSTLIKGDVLAIPDDHKETVTLAGFVFTVDGMEKLIKEHVENVIKNEEKAKQTVEETVSVTPGKYAVLHCVLLKENVYKNNPDLKLSYDPLAKILRLRGLNVEVYKMKSVILEQLHKMEEKQVNIHTSIFQFLQHASSKNVSLKIFGANNINASYEFASDCVVLVGCSPEVLWKAEEQMKQDLDHKQISLDNQGILDKREWKELVRQLQKKHSSSEVAVIIDDCLVSGQEGKVSIAGYRKPVAEVYQALSEFVGRNTSMMKEILAKCVAVVKFVEKEKGEVWLRLRKKGVKIEFGPQAKFKSIVLSGSKAEVSAAAALVEELLSSVNSLTVVFDKPGVKSFFKNREHSYVTEVRQAFGCLIRLQEDGEDISKGSEKKMGHPHSEIKLKDGVVIIVRKGDLTHYPVDVVVNASNEDLQHIGGLAEALLKAAGRKLQMECDELVRRCGRLKPGHAVITGAGNLPCKQVIHAVGPRWKYEEREKCVQQLKKAVKESLHLAETYNHCSIAIPAISSGIFGFPLKECAHSIVTAIKESLEESSESGCVKKISLVDLSDNTIQALTDALNKVFKDGSLQPKSPTPQKDKQPSEKPVKGDLPVAFSPEGLKLMLVEKGIEKAVTDVVVGSIGSDLKLGVGPLSKALLKKAGSQLQVEFDQVVQQGQQAQAGHTIQTGAYNLTSKIVLHAVVPAWNAGKGNGMKVLRDIVKECLEKTEALSLNSISFPAIGTGGFGFPKLEVAKLMFEEVLQFSSRKNVRSLQEVHFLLHPNDVENIKAFYEVFEFKSSTLVPPNDGQSAGFFGPISTPVLGIHEMQIGTIKFQVATGDITKENTDVIVNISNANFNAKSGVSKAILEGAGSQVEMECELQASQANNGFITTQGGNLICKNIIHLIPDSDINSQVSKVLQECELRKYSSVAFPAIGTGQGGKSPENAADEMIGAIADFAGNKSPHHVKVIKIVIFQPHMQKAFYACMKNKEGSSLPSSTSLWSRVKSFVTSKIQPTPKKRLLLLETKLEAAVFEICGEHKKNVEDTEAWLKQLILQEQEERRISDVLIDMFDEEEIKQLNDLQRRLHIAIHLDKKKTPPSILVSGCSRHVLEAQMKIQNLIQRIKDDREEESKAKLAQNLVEWQYSPRGDLFLPFSLLENLHLEDAKVNNNRKVEINIEGRSFKADIKNMTATDDQGTSINIRRLGKEEGKLLHGLPKNWEDMNGALVKSVALQPSTPEYKEVEQKFQATCHMQKIEKIERIQNPYLWQSYKVKKEEMNNKNGHGNNEKVLFHGTPSSAIIPINQTGFDRGYAGKNAAMIGNGTYFAVNANYSAQDTYATPDPNGRKCMYLARVLTGDFTVGKRNQITPPPKTPGGFDWYDSVTDNLANPSMFVIFHDTQAYPEYLITFRN
ncbi:protein mono-ADP-ribosyltransferase PARP14 [Sphaerodactylus townsendi]|uniref:protein mono-ADP-ribosyltransferase PARP14 n=1 Tax=Sphaerodactylus townsendi TaxID=933632 RepID=UPI00202622FE|nr:protein mono-ADP-ribosyltransferase PARP14 [Sphaerodactylus townsendi]